MTNHGEKLLQELLHMVSHGGPMVVPWVLGWSQGATRVPAHPQVIMATNRADTLDPALLRPGRLDRKIEFPLPDRRQKRLIFSTITGKMNLSEEVDLEDCIWGHVGTPRVGTCGWWGPQGAS